MNIKSMLEPMCREWSRQYRRIAQGGVIRHDGVFEPDGWPTTTILAKLREERDGAGQRRLTQHFAEVYRGDGLLIWRAMDRMPLPERQVLYARFLSRDLVKVQAELLGVSVAQYWTTLDRAYYYLAGRLDVAGDVCAETEFS